MSAPTWRQLAWRFAFLVRVCWTERAHRRRGRRLYRRMRMPSDLADVVRRGFPMPLTIGPRVRIGGTLGKIPAPLSEAAQLLAEDRQERLRAYPPGRAWHGIYHDAARDEFVIGDRRVSANALGGKVFR